MHTHIHALTCVIIIIELYGAEVDMKICGKVITGMSVEVYI